MSRKSEMFFCILCARGIYYTTIVHMINLISNNNKTTNAPEHPVYMMCIRVAYAHACVRARVCGLVCICMYTSIVDLTC